MPTNALDWPLARLITEVPRLVRSSNGFYIGEPALFEDARDTALLRELQRQALAQPGGDDIVIGTDATGSYLLLLRDQLPPGVPEGIDTLRFTQQP